MRALLGDKWVKGILDYYRGPRDLRLDVHVWMVLDTIEEQYFERSPDWKMIWQYLKRLGPRLVLRKIRSRLAERDRNKKFLSVGVGSVLEAPGGIELEPGDLALFLAYNHPRCVDRVCVDCRFAVRWKYRELVRKSEKLLFVSEQDVSLPEALSSYKAWSPYSGFPVDRAHVQAGLEEISRELRSLLESPRKGGGHHLPKRPERRAMERTEDAGRDGLSGSSVRAVLFGLGNYAKTSILPNLPSEVRVDCIHEQDPLQIGELSRWNCRLDTCPELRDSEDDYDVYFLAGYHHTHAPLAVDGMKRGGSVVVEKPVATEEEQLKSFEDTVRGTGQAFYVCFHKRYAPYTKWAQQDLPKAPVHYHCLVFEEKLPVYHWYRWPRSRSRVLSNGCHWIDHFMFLNDYAKVRSRTGRRLASGDVLVSIELENSASFSMTLTDNGSSRLGVRDHIELRSQDVTVTISDSAEYMAENSRSVIRRRRWNPGKAYRTMYRQIGKQILEGHSGDSLKSLRSAQVALDLDRVVE